MPNEIKIECLEDIQLLKESCTVECKSALGQNGKGSLPKDFWQSYSALANTYGGVILLGVKEKNGQFSISGLTDTDKVLKEIATGANNPSVVSANLLNDQLIEVIDLLEGVIIKVTIPEAPRKLRPVYLKNTPFNHSYRRFNDSDQLMSDEDVKRALAEQVNETRDNEILLGYGIVDLNPDSLKRYRQLMAVRNPQHPFNEVDDLAFLERIGAWRKDRESGKQGLTLAGLLMFGQDYLIREKLPNYQLDYRDGFDSKYDSETRWQDRVTLDGTWSGNLFDFYQIVYRKLTTDLKVPFELEKGVRKDSTPLHDAIRESLCNVLVHADYSGRTSVLIEKKPDMILFRNPGLMRIPVETAIRGGEPDCRNRILHQMFFILVQVSARVLAFLLYLKMLSTIIGKRRVLKNISIPVNELNLNFG
ncbi:AlbA family DNA-binding domain-containing protein [Thiomicrospira cyclica]|uniref:AlbA family DNA-binding domain-containing protein n=1 Tax=Thiomicrospira cyclica TaxID=147268 RepID=UPI0002FCC389|nr:RNA-binding domain-containing protein [Thiomicrospira cyclica]